MLGHDDIAELVEIEPVPIGQNVDPVVGVDDALVPLHGVHTQGADFSRLDPLNQGLDIRQLAAGAVDDYHAVPHFGDGFPVDDVAVGVQQRHVEGDDIRLGQQGVEVHIGDLGFHCRIAPQVIGQNPAAEAGEIPGNLGADPAGADDADGQILHLAALEAGEREVVDLPPPQSLLVMPQAHEDHHDGEVGHAVGGIAGAAHPQADGSGVV